MEQRRLLISSSCPNCGAPVADSSFQCEYCGSKFARIGIIDSRSVNRSLERLINDNLEMSKTLVAQPLMRSAITPNDAKILFGLQVK